LCGCGRRAPDAEMGGGRRVEKTQILTLIDGMTCMEKDG